MRQPPRQVDVGLEARLEAIPAAAALLHAVVLPLLIALVPLASALGDEPAPSYELEIGPILRTYCLGCHADASPEGGLSMDRYASLRQGGDSAGDPVRPGDAAGSPLIARLKSTEADHMPPLDQPQPTAADVALLHAWIEAGAAGPAVDRSLADSFQVPQLPGFAGPLAVTALAESPDGSRRAVARGGRVEILPTAAAGRPLTFDLGEGAGRAANRIVALHFSPDGTRLVAAGGTPGHSGLAEIRDATTGGLLARYGGHRDMLLDAELSPDGRWLATAGYDRSVKIWNTADGALAHSIDVHTGAVNDLAWHPEGRVLASASADETVKLWRAPDGLRLDTLSQPQGEVLAVAFTPDGGRLLAAGRDRRIHAWRIVSLDSPATNPPLESRFAHESPIVALAVCADGLSLATAGEDGSLRAWTLPDVTFAADLPRQPDGAAVLAATRGGLLVGRMNGSIETVALTGRATAAASLAPAAVAPGDPAAGPAQAASPLAAQAGSPPSPTTLVEEEPNDTPEEAAEIAVPGRAEGTIGRPGDADCFRFPARRGTRLVLEIDAARSKSRVDSRLEILSTDGRPVEQVVLQAVRDSWFTFRGKDSRQSDDFRLHNWMEMELDEYLFAAGEVVRLWHYPRGPDSGFRVYPGDGQRHAFFGTTAVTHSLGEPAWIVRALPPGANPPANGLPVFRLPYANDDEPGRRLGSDSQILFDPPADGDFVVRVSDVRGLGGDGRAEDWRYALHVREAAPSFEVAVGGRDLKVSPGSGRELAFTVTRIEGFDGPVTISARGLPAGFTFHGPVEIAAGQRQAFAVLSAAADAAAPGPEADKAVALQATARIGDREVVRSLGTLGDIQLAPSPKVSVAILPREGLPREGLPPAVGPVEFVIRPGETIMARVRATRHDFEDRIELGNDSAGRNLPHGVYVDNIGLNGLLIVEGQVEREFFITASPVAGACRRLFHLKASADGGQASLPAILSVVP
jgi:hypothetical protein